MLRWVLAIALGGVAPAAAMAGYLQLPERQHTVSIYEGPDSSVIAVVRHVDGKRSVEIGCTFTTGRQCYSTEYAYGAMTLASAFGGERSYTVVRYGFTDAAIDGVGALQPGSDFKFAGEASDTTYLAGEAVDSEHAFDVFFSIGAFAVKREGEKYHLFRTKLQAPGLEPSDVSVKVGTDGSTIGWADGDGEFSRTSREILTPLASDILAYFMFDADPASLTREFSAEALVCFAKRIAVAYEGDYTPYAELGAVDASFGNKALEKHLLNALTGSQSPEELRAIVRRTVEACAG